MKPLLTATVFIALACFEPPVPATRCIDVKPICQPGTHPICICESDISLRCRWICASQ